MRNAKVYVYVALVAVLTLVACDAPQAHDNNTAQQVVGSSPTTKSSVAEPSSKIDPQLAQAIVSNPTSVEFMVGLAEQRADYSRETLGMSKDEKNAYVSRKDEELAERTQPAIQAVLDELKSQGDVATYKSYDIFNGFFVRGTAKAVSVLAARKDVGWLEFNGEVTIDLPPVHHITATSLESGPFHC